MTIVVMLPAPLEAVGQLLRVMGHHWPNATVDTTHPDGWRIVLEPRKP